MLIFPFETLTGVYPTVLQKAEDFPENITNLRKYFSQFLPRQGKMYLSVRVGFNGAKEEVMAEFGQLHHHDSDFRIFVRTLQAAKLKPGDWLYLAPTEWDLPE